MSEEPDDFDGPEESDAESSARKILDELLSWNILFRRMTLEHVRKIVCLDCGEGSRERPRPFCWCESDVGPDS